MKTSVVIPVHNQLKFTRRLLKVMAAVSPPDQLIIVDNASSDGTVEFLREIAPSFPAYHIITNTENKGFGAAMNQGLACAWNACIVCMSNDITIVTPDWLEEIKRSVTDDPEALFGVNMVADNALVQTADGEFIPYLAGWIVAMGADAFFRLAPDGESLWDERFFAYYEDVDLTQRALGLGIKVRTLAGLGLIHHGGKTAFSLPNQPDILKDSRRKYADKWGLEWKPFAGLGEA